MTPRRLDALVSTGLAPMLRRMHPTQSNDAIPILMYHSVTDTGIRNRHTYFDTHTTPQRFREQVAYLRDNGYHTIGFPDLAKRLHTSPPKARKSVVITFDDGYRSVLTHAMPVLRRYGATATVFLPTAYIGNQRKTFQGEECLTWDEVKALHGEGISFGSHTVSHPRLQSLSDPCIEIELRDSKHTIETHLKTPVDSFSYPHAFPESHRTFIDHLEQQLTTNGFRYGVSTAVGLSRPSQNMLFLRRIPVNHADHTALFAAKLAGAYDWVHGPQLLHKRIKHLFTLDEKPSFNVQQGESHASA